MRLTTSDGISLTADVTLSTTAGLAAVVAHPHPLYGGDRHNHVVDAVWRTLAQRTACALRFDFRGTGDSGGHHDGGGAEQHDVIAALDEVTRRCPGVPVWLVGYSFGALQIAEITDDRVAGWVLIAPPLGLGSWGRQPRCAVDPRPTVILVPQHDEFCSPACVEQRCATWVESRYVVIDYATHGLIAHGTRVADLIVEACCATP